MFLKSVKKIMHSKIRAFLGENFLSLVRTNIWLSRPPVQILQQFPIIYLFLRIESEYEEMKPKED